METDNWESLESQQINIKDILQSSFYNQIQEKDFEQKPTAPSNPDLKYSDSEILNSQPPLWLPDSFAPNCGYCQNQFQIFFKQRHHCRYCGKIFCHECCQKKLLLPKNFCSELPQRVCNQCYNLLLPHQTHLAQTKSQSTKFQIFDSHDSSTVKTWINLPYSWDFNYEIYKCTNTINRLMQCPTKQVELEQTHGLLIMSCFKVSTGCTMSIGSGLLLRKIKNNLWSPPSAVLALKSGIGLKLGLESIDLVIFIKNQKDLQNFINPLEIGFEASESITQNIFSKTTNNSFLMSLPTSNLHKICNLNKGLSIGISLEGIVILPRNELNYTFYGLPYTQEQILFSQNVQRPKACSSLYNSLNQLFQQNNTNVPLPLYPKVEKEKDLLI